MNSDRRAHADRIYETRTAEQLSWYRPQLETSLALIDGAVSGPLASLIDVGGASRRSSMTGSRVPLSSPSGYNPAIAFGQEPPCTITTPPPPLKNCRKTRSFP